MTCGGATTTRKLQCAFTVAFPTKNMEAKFKDADAVANCEHHKWKLRQLAVAEGFLVAELRVWQVKIGRKSCFVNYIYRNTKPSVFLIHFLMNLQPSVFLVKTFKNFYQKNEMAAEFFKEFFDYKTNLVIPCESHCFVSQKQSLEYKGYIIIFSSI